MPVSESPICIFSVGHSRHPTDKFLQLLHQSGVQLVVDVRSAPYSKWAPQYCKAPLEQTLRSDDIDYAFLGHELGGRPAADHYYDANGAVNYELRSGAADFVRAIDRLIAIARDTPVAMMCAEENPTNCHRTLLLTPALGLHEVEIRHIRGDGTVVSHDALLRGTQLDLFGR